MSDTVRFAVLLVDSNLNHLQYGIDVGEPEQKQYRSAEELRRGIFEFKNNIARNYKLLIYQNTYDPDLRVQKITFLRSDILHQYCRKGQVQREE